MFAQLEHTQEGFALGARRKRGLARVWAAAPTRLPRGSVLRGARWRRRLLLIAGVAAGAAIIWFINGFLNGIQAGAARKGSTRFAVALVRNDPSAAPSGGGQYVSGVRAYFGAVSSATLVGSHFRHVSDNSRNHGHRYPVTELFLETSRGPAVLELSFDNGGLLGSEAISGVHELKPSDAPGLTPAQRTQLAAAFAARGGRTADEMTLGDVTMASLSATGSDPVAPPASTTHVPTTTGAALAAPTANPQLREALRKMRCIQRAHGDIGTIQKCVEG
jgi:hypothetical protein